MICFSGNCASFVELVRNVTSFTNVYFIGRLALECRMGNDSVVLVDVEGCLLAHIFERFKPVQVQSRMLQHSPPRYSPPRYSPPRFDHALREYNVDLGQDALDRTTSNECIHICVEVLAPAVHEHLRDHVLQSLGSFDQEFARCAGVVGFVGLPRQDAPREVIDHSVNVHFGSAHQSDQRRIHVPDLVGFRGSDSNSGFRWMEPGALTAPTMFPYQSQPCRS